MADTPKSVSYRRRGGEGALVLRGAVDIFEAAALHAAAQRALSDTRAGDIHIDAAEMERIDVSALQILAALKRDLETAGRAARRGDDAAGVLEAACVQTGITL